MRRPRPPHPPRCLCNSFTHWLLGIVSPSRLWLAMEGGPLDCKKARRYWESTAAYRRAMLRWKIETRTCTREEYREYESMERRDRWIARGAPRKVKPIQVKITCDSEAAASALASVRERLHTI